MRGFRCVDWLMQYFKSQYSFLLKPFLYLIYFNTTNKGICLFNQLMYRLALQNGVVSTKILYRTNYKVLCGQ